MQSHAGLPMSTEFLTCFLFTDTRAFLRTMIRLGFEARAEVESELRARVDSAGVPIDILDSDPPLPGAAAGLCNKAPSGLCSIDAFAAITSSSSSPPLLPSFTFSIYLNHAGSESCW